MGIPYSRQINAAFEQVTPLVAAGFQVLRTTRDISILLAVIQVLTVFFLGLIFATLIALLYSVNPDLEEERKLIVTPWLRYFASITLSSVIKKLVSLAALIGVTGAATWHFFLAKQWVEDVEYEANVGAEKALEDLEEEGSDEKKDSKGNKK
ncbi:hypothetical protein EJ02DRAFT_492343 [Clathrospora elynae]|uniref:Uncharacterized protein n=1 Tax=Clathrospora elynae TaxID=706981 RepID=A0A6A5SMV1_9PLEO|nr:hypothetical protein EJ02DRAFT_492343 [Clathrospora elynae]